MTLCDFLSGRLRQRLIIEPPGISSLKGLAGLRPKVVAVALQVGDVDGAALDRPLAPPSGFVVQVSFLVGRAGKDALTRRFNHPSPVGWPDAVYLARHEGFDADSSAPFIASSSLSSMIHTPLVCRTESFEPRSDMSSVKKSAPASVRRAVHFFAPCSPSKIRHVSILQPG